MHVKDELLLYLDAHRDRYVSGEELMAHLSLSRTSLWHNLRSLRSGRYHILSEHGAGYRLADSCELYTAPALSARLQGAAKEYTLDVRTALTSTNKTLREMAKDGAPTGTVLIANKQSAGYGRHQRVFFSPNGGIYMSLLLRPQLDAARALTLTTAAAVAVVEVIKELTGRQAYIKWVNDIYLDEKKVCGILTESALTPNGQLDYAILGIGVNIFAPGSGFPKSIQNIAGAIYPEDTPVLGQRSAFLVALLNRLATILPESDSPYVHAAYCKASFLPGHTVTVLRDDGSEQLAAFLGIDEQYRLLVRYADGSCDALFSGEVSIRKMPSILQKSEEDAITSSEKSKKAGTKAAKNRK